MNDYNGLSKVVLVIDKILTVGVCLLALYFVFENTKLNAEISSLKYDLEFATKQQVSQLPKDIQSFTNLDNLKFEYDLLRRHTMWLEEELLDRLVNEFEDNTSSISQYAWITYILKGSHILLDEGRNLNKFPKNSEICSKLKAQYPNAKCWKDGIDE